MSNYYTPSAKDLEMLRDIANDNYAKINYHAIIQEMKEFQNNLDNEQELAVMLCNFGQSIMLYVTDVSYINSNLICFEGFISGGQEAKLIQHISQINFLLKAAPKSDPNNPPRRIGFVNE